jgi:hypothetical protein
MLAAGISSGMNSDRSQFAELFKQVRDVVF